jgi:uncharacterized protein (TIGR03083 family)
MTIEWDTRVMDASELLEALRHDSAALLAAAHAADPTAAIAACPGWRPVDLVWHIGEVHWFWSTIVADRLAGPDAYVEPDRPDADDDVFAFAEQAAVRLDDALSRTDPSTEVWTWSEPHNAGFVIRRMAHETAVHRVDAELALGIEPLVDPAVAVDGVEEFLENLPRSRALRGEGERLRLRATDQPEGWTVTLGPERFGWVGGEPDGGAAGAATRAVTVQATAAGLYLLLWRRRPPTDARVGVGGDRVLLAHWLQHSVIS